MSVSLTVTASLPTVAPSRGQVQGQLRNCWEGEGKLRQGARKVVRGSREAGGGRAPQKIWLIVNQVEKASESVGDGPRRGAKERGL